MKLWINKTHPAPDGYVWCQNIEQVKERIIASEEDVKYHWNNYGYKSSRMEVELLDISVEDNSESEHIELLDWLKRTKRNYPIKVTHKNVEKRIEEKVKMITWRQTSEKSPEKFECHEVLCDTNLIVLTVLSETRYTVRWYRNGDLDLKKSFDATDLEDAKAYAISAVKEILHYRASHWKSLEDKFNACLD